MPVKREVWELQKGMLQLSTKWGQMKSLLIITRTAGGKLTAQRGKSEAHIMQSRSVRNSEHDEYISVHTPCIHTFLNKIGYVQDIYI